MTILPFTKLFILPLNNELLAVEELKEKGKFLHASHIPVCCKH